LAGVTESDPAAFCRALRPRLSGALGLHCGDADVGEELAQETLLRIWEHWEQVRQLDAPEAWAFRVGFNLATSRFRRRAAERRARSKDHHVTVAVPDLASALAVRRVVRALPDPQRAVIVLRYFLDLPIADVAAVLGCAPGTVKSLSNNAVRLLREQLDFDDIVDEVTNA
jgi:RNA polymerase sigma factor (sigma-70 family)